MTPDIRAASRLTSDSTRVMWFDVGQVPEYSADRPIDAERLMHPPFDRCAICGRDADGDLFVLTTTAGHNSLAIAGLTRARAGIVYMDAFAIMRLEDGSLALHRASDETQARAAVVMVDEWLTRLDTSGLSGYQPVITEHPINRERMRKGKRPMHYTWRTVVVQPSRPSTPQGGTHASPRAHDRRGHWRRHPGGKLVWVKSCRVGDESAGAVFKDYRIPHGSDIHKTPPRHH